MSSAAWPAPRGRLAFWAVTYAFLALLAFSIAHAGDPLVLPYVALLAMLALAGAAVALSPETRVARRPLPAYRAQRPSAPRHARRRFYGALIGVLLA